MDYGQSFGGFNDPFLVNTGTTSGSFPEQEQYQLAQEHLVMRPNPSQYFSGGPSMDHAHATYQNISATQHQQYGSGMPAQQHCWGTNSASHGHGVVNPYYASSQAPQGMQAFPQTTAPQPAFQQQPFQQVPIPQVPIQYFQQADIHQAPINSQQTPIDPQLAGFQQATIPPAAFPQATIQPVADFQQVPISQVPIDSQLADFQQTPIHPQLADFQQVPIPQVPIQHFQQADIHQAPIGFQQTPIDSQLADFQQATTPQAAAPQESFQHVAIPQEAVSQQPPQQPYHQTQAQHQAQAQHQPEEPPSFEQKKAAFRPVPEPQPDPYPRIGAGRKKKYQRFWAPRDADPRLRQRYARLQAGDHRVDIAEEKLALNKMAHQKVHCQNILLRNMQEREDLWTHCERAERGETAIQLPLPQAEAEVRKAHESWTNTDASLRERQTSLLAEHPHGTGADGRVDPRLFKGKDRQGLQSMINWADHHWFNLCDSFDTLRHAVYHAYGVSADGTKALLTLVHKLGCYDQWAQYYFPGNTPEITATRVRFSFSHHIAWELDDGDDPIRPAQPEVQQYQYDQPEAQQHQYDQPEVQQHQYDQPEAQQPQYYQPEVRQPQYVQPEYDQFAEPPHVYPGPVTGPDQTNGFFAQHAQGQQQLQIPQAPVVEGDSDPMAVIEAFNRAQNQLQGLDYPVDQGIADAPVVASWDQGQPDLNASWPDQQPEQPQEQEFDIDEILEGLQAPGVLLSDAQIAEMHPIVGPNGEYQPPSEQQEVANNEGMDVSGDPEAAGAQQETQPEDDGDVLMEDNRDSDDDAEFEQIWKECIEEQYQ